MPSTLSNSLSLSLGTVSQPIYLSPPPAAQYLLGSRKLMGSREQNWSKTPSHQSKWSLKGIMHLKWKQSRSISFYVLARVFNNSFASTIQQRCGGDSRSPAIDSPRSASALTHSLDPFPASSLYAYYTHRRFARSSAHLSQNLNLRRSGQESAFAGLKNTP